ncbi:MAG: hypothetical protein RLZZ292_655 [Bacteroidota bacterium]|jgi:hypothetical protein
MEFNLSGIYKDTFGGERGEFDLIADADTGLDGHQIDFARAMVGGADRLGRPYFMPMRIGDVRLPNEPTILITAKKIIVETQLVGSDRRGSVKELIAFGDYDITIRGIAINEKSHTLYPEDWLFKLNELYNRNEALTIVCGLTAVLGIERIVIKQVTYPEMVGIPNAQGYEFICVSDEDFTLEIFP